MKKLTDIKGSASLAAFVDIQGEDLITSKGNLKGEKVDETELEKNIDEFILSGRQKVFLTTIQIKLGDKKRWLS